MIKLAVIGNPVTHSRSPLIHRHWLQQAGLSGDYTKITVTPEALSATIKDLAQQGFTGVNVTIPHKQAIISLVDEADAAVRAMGAANTLRFMDNKITATNTDAYGFTENLDTTLGHKVSFNRPLVIGAGGAARAVIYALQQQGVRTIEVWNRQPEKVAGIKQNLSDTEIIIQHSQAPQVTAQHDLIINCTPLGMAAYPALTLDLSTVADSAVVYDLVYNPLLTPLLQQAKARGLRSIDGLGMLLYQAQASFLFWTGIRPTVTPALRLKLIEDLGL